MRNMTKICFYKGLGQTFSILCLLSPTLHNSSLGISQSLSQSTKHLQFKLKELSLERYLWRSRILSWERARRQHDQMKLISSDWNTALFSRQISCKVLAIYQKKKKMQNRMESFSSERTTTSITISVIPKTPSAFLKHG